MSKVEEKAEKAYPYPAWSNETTRAINDLRRNAFIEGYNQAEKDLELTWNDIKLIDSLIDDVALEENDTMEDLYQEVLKRFKERKEK